MIKLELDEALKVPDEMKRVLVIYEQAFKNINSIDFAIELLDTVTSYKNVLKNRKARLPVIWLKSIRMNQICGTQWLEEN